MLDQPLLRVPQFMSRHYLGGQMLAHRSACKETGVPNPPERP